MEPLNILFRNEESKVVVLWSIQKGETHGIVSFYEEDDHVRHQSYYITQMSKEKFSSLEHEQLAKGGMTRWDM